MGHIFERIIFDWYSCIREPNTFSVQSKKARKWDFSSNPLQNPWNPRISSTDYWRTDYWVGEVCRQIQTSLWNLHPKAKALFSLRIFWNHLSNKDEVKSSTKALHPSHFSESFVTSEVWLGKFLQTLSRGKNQPDLTYTNLTLVAPWQVLS